jgi:hypothetical protein
MDRRRVCLGFAFVLLAGSAAAQVPLGGEFHVNTYTAGDQGIPYVAADASGKFVVVWTSVGQDGNGMGVFGQRFDASGAPVGPEFAVNTYTSSHQRGAQVAAAPSGEFIVTWTSAGGDDGDGRGVFARRYDSGGTPGPAFRVNSFTTGYQTNPTVAVDGSGNFLVAWLSEDQDGDGFGIYAQRYDASANPQGAEFRVNTTTAGQQGNVAVAMDPAGNFVVSWDHDYYSSNSQVRAQRFNAAGSAVGPELVVTTPVGTSYNGYSSLAPAADGGFVVVWTSFNYGGSTAHTGVFGRRYDASGTPQGAVFQVNTYTTGYQKNGRVASDADGNFVVVWRSYHNQDGHGGGSFAQRFDRFGVRAGSEFRLNTYTTEWQDNPTVAVDGQGNFVTTWADYGQEGFEDGGIYAQRFRPDLIFRDGFESGDLSAWSTNQADSGDLSVSGPAALGGTAQGLQGFVDDVTGLYVQDDSPNDELRYRARFLLDPNGFDPGESAGQRRTRTFIAFTEGPSRRVAAVVLRRQAGVYGIMGRARLDNGDQADTGFFVISDAPHTIEIDLVPASTPDALDGRFELWIDGVSQSVLTGLDNNRAQVDFARLGALSVKGAANGTIYWDEFESGRGAYIGLLP